MTPSETIRQAEKSDISEVAGFLAHAALIHRHLDWQGVLDWIPKEPFLLQYQENHLLALLVCPPDLEKIAWIRCFACDKHFHLTQSWKDLFAEACHDPALVDNFVYSVGLNDWFAELLQRSGFKNFQNIVVLEWNRQFPISHRITHNYFIRPMEPIDLDQVAALDRIAFEPIWVNPPDKIGLAYAQAEHSSVVELDGKIIAYEMTTANHFSAHLARIAVHPEFQKQHIGSDLILEMFYYFKRKGIEQISVNTQNDNSSSLSLYRRMGFELTGESFPVYRFHIS